MAQGERTDRTSDLEPPAGERYRRLVELSPDAIAVHQDGVFLYANPATAALLGTSDAEELLGRSVAELVAPEMHERLRALLREVEGVRPGRRFLFDGLRLAHGGVVDLEVSSAPVVWEGRQARQVVARDVTEQRRAEARLLETQQELRTSEERFSKVFHASPVGITISRLDDGRFLNANDSFLAMTGYQRSEVVGQLAEDLRLWADRGTNRAIADAVRGDGPYVTVEGRLRTRTGDVRHVLASFVRIEVAGEDCVLALGSDISERKAFEEQLRHLAFHDPLTDLPNRALFEDRLAHALQRTASSPEELAVLFLDLDRFKVVNDTLGHTAGDALLADVGRRLRRALPEEHTLTRFGGDEFAILIESTAGREEVRETAAGLIRALDAPFQVLGTRVHVTASIGIAFSQGGESPDDLLRYMDIAMYRAKKEEVSGVRVFDRLRDSEATRRLYQENELRQALERGQLELRFQPIVSLPRGEVRGAEALLRWRHPERGLVPPPEFVPMAEELGLIAPIGEWVLRTACRRAAAWRGRLAPGASFRLSVNLSARQVQAPELVESIERALAETGFPAQALELELTENAAVQATGQLRRLRSIGVRLALDDFGTGYASLAYLRQLEVDTLKIDQSFIHGLERPGTDETLVRSILFLADQLRLEVIAEGVETERQAERLREMGCRRAQGFHFARPLTAEDFEGLLGEGLPRAAGPPPPGRRENPAKGPRTARARRG